MWKKCGKLQKIKNFFHILLEFFHTFSTSPKNHNPLKILISKKFSTNVDNYTTTIFICIYIVVVSTTNRINFFYKNFYKIFGKTANQIGKNYSPV